MTPASHPPVLEPCFVAPPPSSGEKPQASAPPGVDGPESDGGYSLAFRTQDYAGTLTYHPWFHEALRALNAAMKVQQGWDGYNAPPPSQEAFQLARLVLNSLEVAHQKPAQILPNGEGGITFIHQREDGRTAYIECYNTNEIAALVKKTSYRRVWDVAPTSEHIDALVKEVRHFLT
jgi:hypothetical protein